MKSKELAEFTGVTIRTLRHYHALGLLEEPPRNTNGYREYRAADAAQVLRIKHMRSLGFSLQQIKELFATQPQPTTMAEAIDELDRELAEEARRIEEQRALLQHLKETDSDPDAPIEFSEYLRCLRESGASNALLDAERSGLYLAKRESVLANEDLSAVSDFLALLTEGKNAAQYVRLSELFYSLAPDCPESQRQELIEDFSQWFVKQILRGVEVFGWDITSFEDSLSSNFEVLDKLDDEELNAAQLDVSDRITVRSLELLRSQS